jgi:uncharacterized protein YlaI
MSLVLCDDCERVIDSDDDLGCIIDAPDCVPLRRALDTVMCENCRERAWVRAQERAMEDG